MYCRRSFTSYYKDVYTFVVKSFFRLCELHIESKKAYEIEIGYISNSTQHRFVRVDDERM